MINLKIITLLILFSASLFLLFWIYRPGSKQKYDEYSKIPLKNDNNEYNNLLNSNLEEDDDNAGRK